jgi:hypothetical protein
MHVYPSDADYVANQGANATMFPKLIADCVVHLSMTLHC